MAEPASAKFGIGWRNRDEFEIKDEGGIRSDSPGGFALFAKRQFRGNEKLPLRTDFHARQCVAPGLHAAATTDEIMVVLDELFAVHKSAAHFDVNHIVRGGEAAVAFFDDPILKAIGQNLDPRLPGVFG